MIQDIYKVFGEPDLIGKHGCYIKNGDVNLGVLFAVHYPGTDDTLCSDQLLGRFGVEAPVSLSLAVERVNHDQTLLPNITIGFVILDDCAKDVTSLVRAMAYLPSNKGYLKDFDSHKHEDNHSEKALSVNCHEALSNMSISGVIGPISSRQGIMAASLLSVYQIPTLSTSATSDDLSDKSRFGYFLRLVPRDNFQAQAILSFYEAHNWTYTALIYSEGGYGENGAKQIKNEARKRGICIAFSFMFPSRASSSDYEYVMKLLKQNRNAKVITLFIDADYFEKFFGTLIDHGIYNDFVWFGSDVIRTLQGDRYNGILGNGYLSTPNEEFHEALKHWSPASDPDNIWLKDLWESMYNCTWQEKDISKQSCHNYINATYIYSKMRHPTQTVHYKVFDAVMVYAKALHELISDKCRERFTQIDNNILTNCIKGEDLLDYMKVVEFEGSSGYVKFDEEGDLLGQFLYLQRQEVNGHIEWVKVGKWDKQSGENIDIYHEKLVWFQGKEIDNRTSGIELTFGHSTGAPKSVCSGPCAIREQRLEQLLPCCWKCKPCRENEIVTSNGTECQQCKDKFWPSQDGRKCEPIEAEHLHWSDPVVLSLTSLSLICFACSTTSWALFVKHKQTKLIRASSRELMGVIMFGILWAYLTVLMLMAEPTNVTCIISSYSFHLSITLIYCPVLVKSNRVYRIFSIKKTGQTRVNWISLKSQILLLSMFILIMVRSFHSSAT